MKYKNNIKFYEVDLVCNVATNIGCGSRSKPILLKLQNENSIREVKLNRKGNTLVIQWNNQDITSRSLIIASIFSKYNVVIKECNADVQNMQMRFFLNDNKNWLDAAHIDELSREEASEVAKQLISVYEKNASLTSRQKTKLRKDIVAIFYDFFLHFESMDQLSDTKHYKTLISQVIKLSKNYLNTKNTPDVFVLLNAIDGHEEREIR